MGNYQIQTMATAVYVYILWRALSHSTLSPYVVNGHVRGTIVPWTAHVLYFQTKTLQSRHYRFRFYIVDYPRQRNKSNNVLPDIVVLFNEACTHRQLPFDASRYLVRHYTVELGSLNFTKRILS